ncbi:MAG: ATP-binding cassette domain-containing protein [Candidatus Electrothrix aestuarii]|uniref:ATP-binding cassette domain-containing protein n=1 Tax=Candidatus Electrothrix aestuarii TaxID=3062594 RepID=A0AAU8LR63_9BACT|nr:ATP-binding cassette domain-containing protein [Candidatus Electrothrix aestuarii]
MLQLSSLLGGYGKDNRRFLIPQVLQSSMMDCGPAALKAMLGGFGVHVSYARLREACQTDVDGTSIDTLEDLAVQLGLDASQVILPADHLFLPEAEALPALAVMLQPNGFTHFIIIWRLHGPWAQILDPATGRHWIRTDLLKERLYLHQHTLQAAEWQEWAAGQDFCDPLLARLLTLCYDPVWAEARLQEALDEQMQSGKQLAALDAATRMASSLVQAGGIRKGDEASSLIERLLEQPEHIPQRYWSAFFSSDEQVIFQGALLLHAAGLVEEPEIDPVEVVEAEGQENLDGSERGPSGSVQTISSLDGESPEKKILHTLCQDNKFTPLLVISAILLAGFGTAMEVVVLRGLVEIGQQLHPGGQQGEAFMLVILFLLSLLLLEWPLHNVSLRLGRRFELRLRQRFLEKIPRLEDRYFRSRLTSDMVQRAYELRHLRIIPMVGMQALKILTEIICITVGLIILYPQGSLLILCSCLVIIALALVTQPLVQEQDMRFRTHIGGLSRFYLDALLGLLPLRSHSAVPALRSEHERLLANWAKAGQDFFVTYERMTALNVFFSTSLAILLLYSYTQSGGESSGTLILLYWMLTLPQLGRSLAELTQLYPSLRNRLLRLMEPLNTPDETYDWYQEGQEDQEHQEEEVDRGEKLKAEGGIAVQFDQVRVVQAGKTILRGISTQLAPGEQVALVGPSGAGKSTLIGLLLGWYRPELGGTVRVNSELLQGELLQALRRELVWVDPEVQLWNRTFQGNLNYGNNTVAPPTAELLSQAELLDVLSRLPDGEGTVLGENGGFLSGGEGQRVRLGRGLNREAPRLVLLDEPFRGLTREQRRNLLIKARLYWQGATLIFISHDVSESLDFDRVWMMKDGQLVEDGQPQELAACPDSAYAQLLQREKSLRRLIWDSTDWIRLRLEKGKLYPVKEQGDAP